MAALLVLTILLTGFVIGVCLGYYLAGLHLRRQHRKAHEVQPTQSTTLGLGPLIDEAAKPRPAYGDEIAYRSRDIRFPEIHDYVCTLTDWGPDFTGVDDILPRWRWVITPKDSPGTPVTLGNADTRDEAISAAIREMDASVTHDYALALAPE